MGAITKGRYRRRIEHLYSHVKRIDSLEDIECISLSMLPLRVSASARFVNHTILGNVHRISGLNRCPTALRWQHAGTHEEGSSASHTNRKSLCLT